MKELKVTKEMINESRHQGYKVYGTFKGFCDLHSCCEECNKKIKFFCKVKNKIEDIQTKIIDKNCK